MIIYFFSRNRKVVERYSKKVENKDIEYEAFGRWTCLKNKQ